ncbi:hypothetical protein Krodi_1086 [Dokdonia sp. 4H-3-7-5]|nr:hypothetical protein Krodi_1086 [Dokdonia sp. 4H-3-7-5]
MSNKTPAKSHYLNLYTLHKNYTPSSQDQKDIKVSVHLNENGVIIINGEALSINQLETETIQLILNSKTSLLFEISSSDSIHTFTKVILPIIKLAYQKVKNAESLRRFKKDYQDLTLEENLEIDLYLPWAFKY